MAAEFVGGDLFLAIVPNVADGFRYRVCAEDPGGNATCSDERQFSEGASPTPDAGVDSGAGGSPGVGAAPPPAADASATGADPESPPAPEGAALPAASRRASAGCALNRAPSSHVAPWPFAALVIAGLRHRRRADRGRARG